MHPQDAIIIPLILLGFVLSMTVIASYELVKRWQYAREHPNERRPAPPDGEKMTLVIDKNPAGCLDNLLKLSATSAMGCMTVTSGVALIIMCLLMAIILAILAITGMTVLEFFSILGESLGGVP